MEGGGREGEGEGEIRIGQGRWRAQGRGGERMLFDRPSLVGVCDGELYFHGSGAARRRRHGVVWEGGEKFEGQQSGDCWGMLGASHLAVYLESSLPCLISNAGG